MNCCSRAAAWIGVQDTGARTDPENGFRDNGGLGGNLGRKATNWSAAMALGLAFACSVPAARAATFTIADGDVAGLIAAVQTANSTSDLDTINLAPGGTYTLTVPAEDDGYAGPAGLPYVRSPLIINGQGATIRRSSAAGTPDFRIIYVFVSDLALDRITLTGGRGGNGNRGGGAIGIARGGNSGRLLVTKAP